MQELSTKMTQFVWRKLSPNERDLADDQLNRVAFELLKGDDFDLARRILEYGIYHTGQGQDSVRRMMVVNYANALNLGGDRSGAIKELDKLDWSATELKFRISVAAVRGETKNVVEMMKAVKKSEELSEHSYRTWPVFRMVKGEALFQDEFRRLYGSEVIATPTKAILEEAPNLIRESLTSSKAPERLH